MSQKTQEFQRYVHHVGGVNQAARRLGFKPRMIYAMIAGTRAITPQTADLAERTSCGAVSRVTLVFDQ